MYIDRYGLIVQVDLDGGDCAAREGFFYAGIRIRQILGLSDYIIPSGLASFRDACSLLITDRGLIRHPVKWNDPKDTSRDQTRPMIIALGLWEYLDLVEKIRPKGVLKRYQNGDFYSPEDANTVRRALRKNPWSIDDLFAFGDAWTRCDQSACNPDDVGDDVNTLLTLVYFYVVKPTYFAKEALKYYFNHRRMNNGNIVLGKPDPVQGAIAWYFRTESGGNIELYQLWAPIIEEIRHRIELDKL